VEWTAHVTRLVAVAAGRQAAVLLVERGLRALAHVHAPVRDLVATRDTLGRPPLESLEAYLTSEALRVR
jgi:hypothetical protein